MSEVKFTKGPWSSGRQDMASIVDGVDSKWIYAGDEYCAIASGRVKGSWETVMSNAHLIAAAPELYEMLQIARDYVASELNDEKQAYKGYEASSNILSIEEDIERIDAALAKARGETK